MSGWHEGTLAGFDIESTGTDPETARIVTAAVITRGGVGRPVNASWLVNPGIDIPAEATAVHGITTEKAQTWGISPAAALAEITDHLTRIMADGIPLVIYNAPYDLTVMDRETRRNGMEPFGDVFAGLVIDPFVLDKHVDPYRRGKRTLTAVAAHYKVHIDGAHQAGADALAAMRVAWRIACIHPEVAGMSLAELHELQVAAKAEQAASFQAYLMRQGKTEIIDGEWPFRHYEAA